MPALRLVRISFRAVWQQRDAPRRCSMFNLWIVGMPQSSVRDAARKKFHPDKKVLHVAPEPP